MDKFIPVKFQDFCKLAGINHYADSKTYESINIIWKIIYDKIDPLRLPHQLNYESIMNYLNLEYTRAQPSYRYIYYSIIQEFQKYQINAELFAAKYTEYMGRLKGYSRSRRCYDINHLKSELDEYLKKMKVDNDHVRASTRDFIIMSRYICDYLEERQSEIPIDFFQEKKDKLTKTELLDGKKTQDKKIKHNKSKTKIADKMRELTQDVKLV
jgi:hypothetical protein